MKIPKRWVFVCIAILAITPIATIMGVLVAGQVRELTNPCMSWGQINGGSITVASGGLCSSASATSDTMTEFLVKLILIPGGILFGALLGVVGVLGKSQALLISSFIILILESPLLMFDGLFVLTLPPAVFFLWVARSKATTL
ncbi:MAG: hypothetical protein OK422_04205 [Thaumarchaeota archaeon]|nr:hypothetical protein [Nitrososphaerota archaeon]